MSRFVRFTDGTSGSPILVNVDHVADAAEFSPARTLLFQDFCTGDDGTMVQAQLIVDGTLDEVQALLNGEARHVCGRLHPDITDVRLIRVDTTP